MGKQSAKRHIIALTDQGTDLPAALSELVEKRSLDDRRRKSRRNGPPRRSLGIRDAGGIDATPRSKERRQQERRISTERRAKSRRR